MKEVSGFNITDKEFKLLSKKAEELDNSKKRLDRLVDVYLDNAIDKDIYERKKSEITKEINLLESQIANFNNNLEQVHISMKYLLEVVSRVYELYASSENERKRKILKLVFPNFWLNGSKLSYDIRKPFDLFIKRSICLLNWAGVDFSCSVAFNGNSAFC